MWEIVCYALCFFAEGITAWAYYEQIFARKRNAVTIKLLFLVGYFLLFGVSQNDNVLLNGLSFIIINCLLLYINYNCRRWVGLLQVGYLTFVMGGTEILIALLLSLFVKDFDAYRHNLSVMIAFTVLGRLLYFFIMQISARHIKPVSGRSDGGTVILLSVMPLSSVIIAIAFIYMGMMLKVDGVTGTLMTVSILALLAINIIVVIIYNQMQRVYNEHLELELIAQKEKINTERYKLLQEQYDGQRVLIHDIRRHIHIMKGLIDENQISELKVYLQSIEDESVLKRIIKVCDHPVLNIILVHYAELCISSKIDYHFVIRTTDFHNISLYDITAIFDNLLANAIEAAKDSEEKIIDLCVSSFGENRILVSVINSCDHPPEQDVDKKYVSRKENKEKHGIGLRSIHQAIKRYQGISEMHYDSEERRFHSVLQLTVDNQGELIG